MDRSWTVERLRAFVQDIDALVDHDEDPWNSGINQHRLDEVVAVELVMRDLMNAARPGLGDYAGPGEVSQTYGDPGYWETYPKKAALRAIGVLTLGAEAYGKLRPDSPDLVADQFHPWVWEAAAPLWFAGSRQEAVHAAARSVNARLQQKLSRSDQADAKLCREAFSLSAPGPGQPRLRFPGDSKSETWRSRQNGGIQLGAGCFEGIRNPAAHEDGLDLTEQVALEQLAAFSLLARWIDECTVETFNDANSSP
jgi:hypothetical protein